MAKKKGISQDVFRAKAPWIMKLLMRDFTLDLDSAAAVLGNLGHECAGFTLMQEQKPTVKGSRGGYGWAQWTGPRRRAFEAYCDRHRLNPAIDEANYRFLFVELTGSEKAAIAAVRKAGTLAEKVKRFELKFERAGVKHYASRNRWAAIALEAFKDADRIRLPAWAGSPVESDERVPAPTPRPEPEAPQAPLPESAAPEKTDEAPKPAQPKKLRWSARFWTWLTTGGAGSLVGMRELGLFDLDWTFWLILSGLIVTLALIGILTMPQVRQALSMRLVGIFGGIAAIIGAAMWAGPADAQPLCAPLQTIAENLLKTYGELPIGGGVTLRGSVLTVFAAPDGKTFTIVMVGAGGLACPMAAGRDWKPGTVPVAGEPT